MAMKIKGHKFGDWEPKNYLGEGGNGFVWLAINSKKEEAAIKLLARLDGKNKEKVYERFRSEVNVIRANNDIQGLLPIIDFHLPDDITSEIPWYVMPVAQPLDEYLTNKNFEIAIQVILELGNILINLHDREICHRDIKPANILIKEDKVCLGDFGLVDYPDRPDLTSPGEQIGAKWTMAPEMKRNSHTADGKPADVYSLAKTLWILLTDRKDGFEGQYNPNSVNGLSRLNLTEPQGKNFFFEKAPLIYTKPLDELLRASTDDDPLQRPSMSQFVERLGLWVDIYRNFSKRNPLQWQDVHTKLFPTAVPQRAIWENIDTIVDILNYLGSFDSLNHMLLPAGGGMNMLGAERGLEPNTIELLIHNRDVYIIKPKRLIFESFDFDWEWNYFWLETSDLEPIGIGNVLRNFEELIEVAPLHYVSEADWDRDRDEEKKYPLNSRHILRYIDGDFLILQQTSIYNRIPATYDGRHSQMGVDEFRNYIAKKVQLVQQILQDKQVAKLAAKKGWTIDEFIFEYLQEVFRQESLEKFMRKV
jgi:serine/threonine-protein kinase